MKHSTAKELFGGLTIAVFAELKIHWPALFIDRAVEVHPFAFDLDIGLIRPPRTPDRLGVLPPTLLEHRDKADHPAHDRRMRHRQPALGHHFDEVSVAQLVPHIPADAQGDDEPVEVTALEEVVGVVHATDCR
jgi:hypothetical protein